MMKNIKFTFTILFICAGLSAQKQNVLFILVDDLKPTINAFGASQMITPNFDSFADQSVVFTNTQCQQAVCAASRVSFMTGMRPDYTQILDLKTHMRDKVPNSLTLPEYFKQNGYETAGIGKVLHGAKNNDPQSWSIPFIKDDFLPFNSNFDVPVDHQYQNKKTKKIYRQLLANNTKKNAIRKELAKAGGRPSTEMLDIPDNAYADGALALRSIELLKTFQKNNTPFFLTVGFHKPHLPFVAPKKYWDLYDRDAIELAAYQKPAKDAPQYALHTWGELKGYSDIKKNIGADGLVMEAKQRELIHGYYASVSYIDAQLGLLLEHLKSSGLQENTVVVLIGDHGWHLGDHGVWNKHTNYEQATRTPLFVMTPKGKKGVKNASPTELIDVFPTLCEGVGLASPSHLQGKSLMPIVKGEKTKVKEIALSQFPRGPKMGYAARSERYRYIEWREGNYKKSKDYIHGKVLATELYDYKVDPLEKRNLIDDPDYSDVKRSMQTHLNQLVNN